MCHPHFSLFQSSATLRFGHSIFAVCFEGLDFHNLDKPADRAAARRDLVTLRGRDHEQVTAACVACDGHRLWHATQHARLRMRDFSDDFLDRYLDDAGDGILGCAGGYQLEGVGVQLFSRVEGDYFAILGLPLLPLLDFLRGHRVVVP